VEINLASVAVSVASLLGAILFQALELRRAIRERDDALARVFAAEARACAAVAETESADAIAAKLWLHIEPGMGQIYLRALRIFGKAAVDRNMRQAVERGEWKLPEGTN
jgi:hypothetical protein